MPYREPKDSKEDNSTNFDGLCKNIILTGLTGCGKTEVGKILAQIIGWGFLDTDELIEKSKHKSPSKIIQTKGLPYFRNCEFEAISSLHFLQNHVISLGGGALCEKKNRG